MKIGQKLLKTPLKLFKLPIKTKNTIFPPAVEIEKRDLQIMLYCGIKRKIKIIVFIFEKTESYHVVSVYIVTSLHKL